MWTLVSKKSTTSPTNTGTVPWIDNLTVTYVPTDNRGMVFPDAAVKLQAAVITEPEFQTTATAAKQLAAGTPFSPPPPARAPAGSPASPY